MPSDQVPLYVRLGREPSRRLDQAVATSGLTKRQIVEQAVQDHLDACHPVVGRVALREVPPDVLTLQEAAALLRVSEADLEASAAADQVPARRIATEWRFSRPALLAWLDRSPTEVG